MSRKLYLGNDRDETIRRVFNDILHLLLGIEASVLGTLAIDALRADLGQFRVLLDLDTPSLVVGQVPMHAVDLEQGQYVQLLLDILYRDEMAAGVEHDTAVAESRLVLDRYGRSGPCDTFHGGRTLDLGGQQLQERLHTVEKTLRGLGFDTNAAVGYVERVSLVVYVQRAVDNQRDTVGGLFVGGSYLVACRRVHFSREELGYGFRLRGGSVDPRVFV